MYYSEAKKNKKQKKHLGHKKWKLDFFLLKHTYIKNQGHDFLRT